MQASSAVKGPSVLKRIRRATGVPELNRAFWVGVLERALSLVWLPQPHAVRIRVDPSRRAEIRADVERARSLKRGARNSSSSEIRAALLREALRNLLVAAARAEGSDALGVSLLRQGVLLVEPTLRSDAERDALHRCADERPSVDDRDFPVLWEVCEWVDALIDNRSERELWLTRRLPWVVGVLVLLVGTVAVLHSKNLALEKPVTASSECKPQNLSTVVDGIRIERTGFAICTATQVQPWVMVDLQTERDVSEVVVYNRMDCCWGVDDLPLSIQVSSNAEDFTTVAVRKKPFTGEFPWRVRLDGRRARYVRLFNEATTPKNIVISEIEVHGR